MFEELHNLNLQIDDGSILENRRTAKATMRSLNDTSINLFAKILDVTLGYVDITLLAFLHFEICKTDLEPLAKGLLKTGNELLYMVGETPQYSMYSADKIARRTVHIHYAFSNKIIELFPFDILRGIRTNDVGKRVHHPDYTELDPVVTYMITY